MSVRSIVMAAAGAGGTSVSYASKNSDLSAASTVTFTSQSIGGPGLIVVAVALEGGSGSSVCSGVTIAGNAMTLVERSLSADGANNGEVTLWRYRIASGTTATIVASFGTSYLRCAIGVWRVTGNASDTPVASATLTNQVGNGTFNLPLTGSPAGSAVVFAGAEGNGPFSTSATVSYGSPMIQDYYESINPVGGSDTAVDGGHCVTTISSYTATTTVTLNNQFVCACAAAWA